LHFEKQLWQESQRKQNEKGYFSSLRNSQSCRGVGTFRKSISWKNKGLIPMLDEQKKHQVISNEELQRLASSTGDYGLLILVAGTVGLRWALVESGQEQR